MKQATKLNQVMLLIKSLSKAEKRYIRLYTNLQNGDKHYMVLYDLACEGFSLMPSKPSVLRYFNSVR